MTVRPEPMAKSASVAPGEMQTMRDAGQGSETLLPKESSASTRPVGGGGLGPAAIVALEKDRIPSTSIQNRFGDPPPRYARLTELLGYWGVNAVDPIGSLLYGKIVQPGKMNQHSVKQRMIIIV